MRTGLGGLPRVRLLAGRRTPLLPAPRLSAALGVEVWLKRDDLTGLGLGGNKVRGLEYLLGHAEEQGCDCLVTGGGPQSNWAMLAALGARVRGLDAHLVYYGTPVDPTGNLRLAVTAGAQVRFTGKDDRASVDEAIESVAEELRTRGRRPYVLPRGGATPRGSVGYMQATRELAGQLIEHDLEPGELWLATGSCATQAGLVAGVRWLALPGRVVGVTVSRSVDECRTRVGELAVDAARLVTGASPVDAGDVHVLGGYREPGYGVRSEAGERAARLAARSEGIFLDPVFTAKAMAGLADAAGAGRVDAPVVFLVTGGAPTLFTTPAPSEAA